MDTVTPSPNIDFSAWLTYWIETYAPLRSSSLKTIERYGSLARYVTEGPTPELAAIARTRLAELHHIPLEMALLSLVRMPATRREHLSIRTVLHVASLIRVALSKAFRLDLIGTNPMLKVELPRLHHGEVRSLEPEEVHRLRASLRAGRRTDWLGALIDLALASGCRRGEMLALDWNDVNPSTRVLRITKSIEQTAAGLRLKMPKSGRSRLLTLPRSTIRILQEYRMSLARVWPLIFSTASGSYQNPALVSQMVVRRLQKAGLPDASLHTLRHTHASILLNRRVPLPALAARLGHADPNTTARIYCHVLPPDDSRASDEWDAFLEDRSDLGKFTDLTLSIC